MKWYDRFKFPVKMQAFKDGEWLTVFECANGLEFEYEIDRYGFASDGVSRWRTVDSKGFVVETTDSEMREYHTKWMEWYLE